MCLPVRSVHRTVSEEEGGQCGMNGKGKERKEHGGQRGVSKAMGTICNVISPDMCRTSRC